MPPILLATDGSEYARPAVRHALELAENRDATLHAICVVNRHRFDEPALSSTELETIYAEEHAAVSVREVEEMAKDRAVTVEGDTRHGIPHNVIVEYADEVDADAIVVGEHDEHFSGIGRKVTEEADREVIVIEGNSQL